MAIQRRQITREEYWRLAAAGVLGEKVEMIDGWIVFGEFPFAFSDQAVAAAREAGVELTVDEYDRLVELGVLGEQVELIDGRVMFGRFAFAFSGEAIAAARAAGIELDRPEHDPRGDSATPTP